MVKATGAETFVNPAPEGFIEEGKYPTRAYTITFLKTENSL